MLYITKRSAIKAGNRIKFVTKRRGWFQVILASIRNPDGTVDMGYKLAWRD